MRSGSEMRINRGGIIKSASWYYDAYEAKQRQYDILQMTILPEAHITIIKGDDSCVMQDKDSKRRVS